MKKMKFLLLGFAGIALLAGCKKDKNKEYFYFKANGKEYKYHQEKSDGSLFHPYPSYALWAGSPSGVRYEIIGKKGIDNPLSGRINFIFNDGLPNQDTVILDGIINQVQVRQIFSQDAYYDLLPHQKGRIVFSVRTAELVKGTFEFEATLTNIPTFTMVDTLLKITEGEFSIIPKR